MKSPVRKSPLAKVSAATNRIVKEFYYLNESLCVSVQVQTPPTSPSHHDDIPVTSTVFLSTLMNALSVRNDDSKCLFSLALIYSLVKNKGQSVLASKTL